MTVPKGEGGRGLKRTLRREDVPGGAEVHNNPVEKQSEDLATTSAKNSRTR